MLSFYSNLEQYAPDALNLINPYYRRYSAVASYFIQITRDLTLFLDCFLLSYATFIAVQSIVSVLFYSLNSESTPIRSVFLSSLSRSITSFLVTQSHFIGYYYLLRIRASGIATVSYRRCSLTLSLSLADAKTRSALSVGRRRIYSIAISSVTLNDLRLRFRVSRITVVSCFSFLTLVVLTVIAVLSSFSLCARSIPSGAALSTSVVAVSVLFTGDGTR
jgi:hypothetical protein